MVNPWRGLAGLPRASWILAVATLVNRAGVMVRPFLVIYLTTQIGLTVEDAGWYLFAYGATTLIAAPLSGRLTDRFGARTVMRVCLLLSACALLIYPLAQTRGWLLFATATFALFNEMPRPALMALVTEVVPVEKHRSAIVLSRLAINLGMGIGPALAGWIVAPRGDQRIATNGQFLALFLIDAGSNLAAAAILWLTRLPRGGTAALPRARPQGRGLVLLADPRLRMLFVATVLSAVVFWQIDSSLALYIKESNLTVAAFGRVFKAEEIFGLSITLNTMLIVLCEVELNFATHHWPQRRNMVIGALLAAAGFGAMTFARSVGVIAFNVVLYTVGEMFLFPAVTTYALAIAPPERRGSYMGVLTLSFGAGFSIGPWIGTRLLHHYGPTTLWPVMFGVGLLSTFCYARLPEPGSHAAEAAPPEPESAAAAARVDASPIDASAVPPPDLSPEA